MLRDAYRGVLWLEPAPRGGRLAPVMPCCGYRHKKGRECPVVRILPPGVEGLAGSFWPDSQAKARKAGLRSRLEALESGRPSWRRKAALNGSRAAAEARRVRREAKARARGATEATVAS